MKNFRWKIKEINCIARKFIKLNEGQKKATYPRSSIHLKGSMKVTINKQEKVYPLPTSHKTKKLQKKHLLPAF